MMVYAEEKSYPVTSVGPDDLWRLDDVPDDLKWLVYWYEIGRYDGDGVAIYACANGIYGCENLGHCSCYGPTEQGSWTGHMSADSVRELLGTDENIDRPRDPEDYDYARWAAIAPTVLALLAEAEQASG